MSGKSCPQASSEGSCYHLIVLLGLATVLRLPFLFDHGLDSDEIYTLRNSLQLFGEPTAPAVSAWPVTFSITHVFMEVFGVSVFSLRLLSVICGILSPLLLYRLGRRLVGTGSGFCAGLLMACLPWHQYLSGYARYYAPLILISVLILDRLDIVLNRHRMRDVGAVLGLLLLALATHATGILAASGVLVVFARIRNLGKTVLLSLLGGVLSVVLVCYLVPTFRDPVVQILSGHGGSDYAVTHFLAGLALVITPLIGVLGLLGLIAMWNRATPCRWYLLLSATVPVVVVLGLGLSGVGIQARYVAVILPAALIVAGCGLDAILSPLREGVRLRLVVIAMACLLPLVPSLTSNLMDGNRHDVPGVALALETRLAEGDILYAEAHSLLEYYLWGSDSGLAAGEGEPPFPRVFGECPPGPVSLQDIANRDMDAWFVLPENMFRRLKGQAGDHFVPWLREETTRQVQVGRRRLDYHQNLMGVYRTKGGRGS